MDLNEAIATRRAVRDYAPREVDQETIMKLIDAAVHAPSAVNQQPWTFTIVRDQPTLDRLSDAAKAHLLSAMAADPHAEQFRARVSDPQFQIFYHAPVLILISASGQLPWIVEDCSLAAENLMLAACAGGLGSCWIGLAQGFLGTAEGKRMLGLPEEWVPVAPIIVGHPRTTPQPVPRNPPQVRWVG